MKFILDFWYLWIAGLFLFPLLAVFPQLSNIHAAIDDKGKNPDAIGKLFLQPFPLLISIAGGIGTFVSFVLFIASIVMAIIQQVKGW